MDEKIIKLLSEVFEVKESELHIDLTKGDIDNWDSLNHMNLVVALEEEFNILFSDDEIVEIVSLDVIEILLFQ